MQLSKQAPANERSRSLCAQTKLARERVKVRDQLSALFFVLARNLLRPQLAAGRRKTSGGGVDGGGGKVFVACWSL